MKAICHIVFCAGLMLTSLIHPLAGSPNNKTKDKVALDASALFQYGKDNRAILNDIFGRIEKDESKNRRVVWLFDVCPNFRSFQDVIEKEAATWLTAENVKRRNSLEMAIALYGFNRRFLELQPLTHIGKDFETSLDLLEDHLETFLKNTEQGVLDTVKKYSARNASLHIILVTSDNGSSGGVFKDCMNALLASEAKLYVVASQSTFQDSLSPAYQEWADVANTGIKIHGAETAFRRVQMPVFTGPYAENTASGFGFWPLSCLAAQSQGAYYFGSFYDTKAGYDPFRTLSHQKLPPNMYDLNKLKDIAPDYSDPAEQAKALRKDPLEAELHKAYLETEFLFMIPKAKPGDTDYLRNIPSKGMNYFDWSRNPFTELANPGKSKGAIEKEFKFYEEKIGQAADRVKKAIEKFKDSKQIGKRSLGHAELRLLQYNLAQINLREMMALPESKTFAKKSTQKYVFQPVLLYNWLKKPMLFEPVNKDNRDELSTFTDSFREFQKTWGKTPFETSAYHLCFILPHIIEGNSYVWDIGPRELLQILNSSKPKEGDPKTPEAPTVTEPPKTATELVPDPTPILPVPLEVGWNGATREEFKKANPTYSDSDIDLLMRHPDIQKW